MPELTVVIGGVAFDVACKEGEEGFLKTAAAMLDNEATALKSALGRIPENRMLLMAGLMLADKTASLEDQLKSQPTDGDLRKRLDQTEAMLQDTLADLATVKARDAENASALSVATARLAQAGDSSGSSDELETLKSQLAAEREAHDATKAAMAQGDDMQTQLNEVQLALESEKSAHAATKTDRDEAMATARALVEKITQTAAALEKA